MKTFFSQYFSFTKKERTGTFVLLFFILIFTSLPFFYPLFIKPTVTNATAFEKEIATLKIRPADTVSNNFAQKNNFEEDNYHNYYRTPPKDYAFKNTTAEVFYFDPNTATTADWQRLGIKDKTITTIKNYLNKGGHFYKPTDIEKIWGLHADEIERLKPYVQIAPAKNNYVPKTYDKPKNTPIAVDVNTADTSAFIALPGIGSKLANRIIKFREKLGGFYKIDQVAETFALPDSTFKKLKPQFFIGNASVKKININTASVDEMKTHPYLRYTIANALVQYRTQHGNFSSITDIKKIVLITDELFDKIMPYLTIQ